MTPLPPPKHETHSLAQEGLFALGLISLEVCVITILKPEALTNVSGFFIALVSAIGALCTGGVVGMTARDAYTGGLTSSAGPAILAAQAQTTSTSVTTETVATNPPPKQEDISSQ